MDTSFSKRSGDLSIVSSNGDVIFDGNISVVADYYDGESSLTLKTRDLNVYGYIHFGEGEIEIDSKSFNLSNCIKK
jgi:hypothetical protein